MTCWRRRKKRLKTKFQNELQDMKDRIKAVRLGKEKAAGEFKVVDAEI